MSVTGDPVCPRCGAYLANCGPNHVQHCVPGVPLDAFRALIAQHSPHQPIGDILGRVDRPGEPANFEDLYEQQWGEMAGERALNTALALANGDSK